MFTKAPLQEFVFAEEKERTRRHNEMEKSQVSKAMQGMKSQLSHERSLKLDAFHQVNSLVHQVSGTAAFWWSGNRALTFHL